MEKTCPHCGKVLPAGNKIYCSQDCTIRHIRKIKETPCKCVNCGKDFIGLNNRAKYCSVECRKEVTLVNKRLYAKEAKSKKKTEETYEEMFGDVVRKIQRMNEKQFIYNFVVNQWKKGDQAEKYQIECLNPDINFSAI